MVKERKHRLDKIFYKGYVRVAYTIDIKKRQRVFIDKNEKLIKKFINILKEEAKKECVQIWIYTFMPDHMHLILEGNTRESNLWTMIKSFKQRTGWEFKKLNAGIRWHKDYYDHIIRKNEDIINQIKYVADNPARKEIVDDWREYNWTGSVDFDINKLVKSAQP